LISERNLEFKIQVEAILLLLIKKSVIPFLMGRGSGNGK